MPLLSSLWISPMLSRLTPVVLKQVVLACLNGVFAFEYWLTKRQYKRTFITKKPVEYDGIVTDEEFNKSRRYSQDRLSFTIVELILTTTLTFFLLRFNFQKYLWDKSVDLLAHFNVSPQNEIWPSLAFISFQMILNTFVGLPFSIYSTFWLEHKHGFNKTTKCTFIADFIKSLVLVVAISFPLVSLLIWIMSHTSNGTFLYLWIATIVLQLFFILAYPIFIQPLFNRLVPLEDGELKQKINQLASRLRFPLHKIYVMDGSKRSSHSNAYFYGVFRCKHIVIFDTLLNQCSTEEIVAILGHELGHWQYGHFIRKFLVAQINLFFILVGFSWLVRNPILYEAFGFTCSLKNPSLSQPIVVGSMLFSILLGPVETLIGFLINCQSRVHEYEADQFACENGLGKHLRSGLVKLLVENKSNMNPDPIYSAMNYSHPTVLERIQRISKYD